MSVSFAPVFYAVVFMSAAWLTLLSLCTRFNLRIAKRPAALVMATLLIVAFFVPAEGLPMWSWAFSYFPNPSLPLLGMMFAALVKRLFGFNLLGKADREAAWSFAAVVGTMLYLEPVIGSTFDLYYWGWQGHWAVISMAALAVFFLSLGNRLGALLLLALAAYGLRALESTNCWDYVVDPVYWIAGVLFSVRRGVRAWGARAARLRASRKIATLVVNEAVLGTAVQSTTSKNA